MTCEPKVQIINDVQLNIYDIGLVLIYIMSEDHKLKRIFHMAHDHKKMSCQRLFGGKIN